MKIIPEWRRAWRLHSVQVAVLAVGFGALPANQQAAILGWLGLTPERIPAVIGLLALAARLLSQKDPPKE